MVPVRASSTHTMMVIETNVVRTIDSIEKSKNDKRDYRGLVMKNGMKVILVSDPETDKAAAAMDVNVGFNSDPDDLPGLAHFCEHMLFLGTKKYPKEDEYHKFISQHGGSCNAYTDCEHTNYHFEVGHEHLRGALDRFSQFFTCPLFDASCTDREVKAVHSEHEKNLMSDAWRVQMLDRATSDPSHVYAKFGTGNKDTLDICPKGKGQDIRKELLKFHDKYYSANIMGLAVVGRQSLDELSEMVLEFLSDAVDKNVQVPSYDKSPYRKEDLSKRCHTVPVQDVRLLGLSFPIPDLKDYYDSKPCHYVSHLIGHEGPGSILSELKSKGWVNSLLAGPSGGSKGFDFFMIQVDLTDKGINHVDDIIEIMLQYIKMLKKEGPKEWIYKELSDVCAMSYDFKDKEKPSSYVGTISCAINRYPMEKVLTAKVLMRENQPDIIKLILDKLTPGNMKVEVLAQAFKGKTDQVEKWYGTEYSLVPIEESLMERWKNIGLNEKLHLPNPNEFIPTRLDIKDREDKNPVTPSLIKNDEFSMIWFKQDDKFKLPKACIFVDFYSPYAYVDPHHCNMVHMFADLFDDALNEYSYYAEIAGLSYDLKNTTNGMTLCISGYEDKQSVLLEKILLKITDFKIDPQRFETLKELHQRSLQNFSADQPYKHAMYYGQVVRSEVAWTKKELYDALPDLTLQSLTEFIPTLLSYLHVEAMMYGNMTKQDALDAENLIVKILKERSSTRSLLPSQLVYRRDVQLPAKSSYVHKHKHEIRDISAVQVYLQVGLQNTRENALIDLMAQIISEPFFNTLRTKEQLGYVVHSGVMCSNGTQGMRFLIQSDKPPDYLDARAEAYIHHIEKILDEMEDSGFARHKNALKTKKLEKPKKMKQQATRYWGEISSKQYMFERNEIEVKVLEDISKEDVKKFYTDYFHIDAPKRAKLSTYIVGKNISECSTIINATEHNKSLQDGLLFCPELPPAKLIKDITKFKLSLPLYPRVEPYIDFSAATLED